MILLVIRHVRSLFAVGLVLVISICSLEVMAYSNWKSIDCKHLDTIYATITCHVKPISRGVASLNAYVKLLRKPLTQLTVDVEFKKRANGWKPFLYKYKIDACRFLGSKNKNPVANFFFEYMGTASHSNLNHSCPYNHDIIFSNHTFQATMESTRRLPLPSRYYGIFTTWISDGKPRIKANAFFIVVDD